MSAREDNTRAFIAIVAAVAAFIVPVLGMAVVLLGLGQYEQIMDLIKTWLAYIGPFAGTVIGYYFKASSERP